MLALLLAALVALPTTSTAARRMPDIDPAWSSDGKFLAFTRLRNEGPVDTSGHIWIVGRDGRGARAVTPGYDPSYFNRPAWSSDGAWLAVPVASRVSAPSVDVMRSDGRDLTEIRTTSGSSTGALRAAWSPDGTHLALSGNNGLFIVDRDVWQARFLVSGGGYPSWSPDGTRIAFASGTLAIVDIVSGAVTPLPAPRALAAWAPDGTRIAYATGCQVGVVRVTQTGNATRARACGENATGSVPSWSPDGRRFAYSQCDGRGACAVRVASAAQPSHMTKIARGENPVWSPDGRRIAYARIVDNKLTGIWLIDPSGAHARPLLH